MQDIKIKVERDHLLECDWIKSHIIENIYEIYRAQHQKAQKMLWQYGSYPSDLNQATVLIAQPP